MHLRVWKSMQRSPTKRGNRRSSWTALICCRNFFSSSNDGTASRVDLRRGDRAGPAAAHPNCPSVPQWVLIERRTWGSFDCQSTPYQHAPVHYGAGLPCCPSDPNQAARQRYQSAPGFNTQPHGIMGAYNDNAADTDRSAGCRATGCTPIRWGRNNRPPCKRPCRGLSAAPVIPSHTRSAS